MALMVLTLASPAQGRVILDFIAFDDVHYLRWAEEPGRQLTRADLGIEFATVECSNAEDRAGCAFGRDAAAAFMPAGTRAYVFGEPRYWLTIWLADGTTLGRPYFTETSELMDGLVVPTEFGSILERYLRD